MPEHIICQGREPEERIIRFMEEHHVMTIATVSPEGLPWCASCFYVFIRDKIRFVFTTDAETRHGSEMMIKPEIAACIALETRITGRIRGVQMTGRALQVPATFQQEASKAYIKRFPVAVLKKTALWIFDPSYIKMTDNRLGFGRKLIWVRSTSDNDSDHVKDDHLFSR